MNDIKKQQYNKVIDLIDGEIDKLASEQAGFEVHIDALMGILSVDKIRELRASLPNEDVIQALDEIRDEIVEIVEGRMVFVPVGTTTQVTAETTEVELTPLPEQEDKGSFHVTTGRTVARGTKKYSGPRPLTDAEKKITEKAITEYLKSAPAPIHYETRELSSLHDVLKKNKSCTSADEWGISKYNVVRICHLYSIGMTMAQLAHYFLVDPRDVTDILMEYIGHDTYSSFPHYHKHFKRANDMRTNEPHLFTPLTIQTPSEDFIIGSRNGTPHPHTGSAATDLQV